MSTSTTTNIILFEHFIFKTRFLSVIQIKSKRLLMTITNDDWHNPFNIILFISYYITLHCVNVTVTYEIGFFGHRHLLYREVYQIVDIIIAPTSVTVTPSPTLKCILVIVTGLKSMMSTACLHHWSCSWPWYTYCLRWD